jgi:amino acid transporter
MKIFSQSLLGNAGGTVYAVVICLSALGALNVKTFTAGRLTEAAARRRWLPAFLETVGSEDLQSNSEVHERSPNPATPWYMSRPTKYKDGTVPL